MRQIQHRAFAEFTDHFSLGFLFVLRTSLGKGAAAPLGESRAVKRNEKLLRGVDRAMLGIEVAPWFAPIAPKSDGYNIRTLDIFDADTLMSIAHDDPSITSGEYGHIEPVDYVGSAVDIATLVPQSEHGTFDYIISSHNFEHLPNPIKFLQGCETVLKEDGQLILAVPDGRACFDYFQGHTSTGDWLEAFAQDRKKPTNRQVFGEALNGAQIVGALADGSATVGFSTPKSAIANAADIATLWQQWQNRPADHAYVDTHCTVMTPASLELMIEDCAVLGLINLEVSQTSPTRGVEFHARLRRRTVPAVDDAAHRVRRTALLHRIWDEHAVRHLSRAHGTAAQADKYIKGGWSVPFVSRVITAGKTWNRARKARRKAL